VLVRDSSRWMLGTAIDTMVWSMKVIATAKIIAVRIKAFGPLLAVLSVTKAVALHAHGHDTEACGDKSLLGHAGGDGAFHWKLHCKAWTVQTLRR
jgi:hypothetical protein